MVMITMMATIMIRGGENVLGTLIVMMTIRISRDEESVPGQSVVTCKHLL